MKINTLIEYIKKNSSDTWNGKKICDKESRDQILFGDSEQECTGIAVTCFASYEVIQKAGESGCNFIIVHESLFWNHGDHTEWLESNSTFQKKKALLKRYRICIWRNHDHLHGGIPVNGMWKDGIFYGISTVLGWNDYILDKKTICPDCFRVPEMTVEQMADLLMKKLRLRKVRFIGNPDSLIRKVYIPKHIMGHLSDSCIIEKMDKEQINCLITLEMVDFTVCEYVRDAGMTGENKCIFAPGHFNLEEAGMEFYAEYLEHYLIKEVPVRFIRSGDVYMYMEKERIY